MASALSAMGDQLVLTGGRREASGYLRRAQQLLATLAGASTSSKLLLGLHDSYYRLVPVFIADGDLASAEWTARRAVAIAQQLVAADAENTQPRVILAADYANLADVVSRARHAEAAQELFAHAMSIDAELKRTRPDSTAFRNIHHQRLLIGGDIAMRSGDCTQAARYYADAVALLRQMMATDPQNEGTRLRLAFATNGVAASALCQQDVEAARHRYQDALALFPNVVESGSTAVETLYAVADSYAGLGEVEVRTAAMAPGDVRTSHLRQALSWFDRSLEVWGQVKEPGLASPSGYKVTPLREVEDRSARLRAQLAARSR
jgi:tetratricopeptide (TPR) repeat protein